MYDRSVLLWSFLQKVMQALPWDKAKDKSKGARKFDRRTIMFWAFHQRFFKSMLMASKVCAPCMYADMFISERASTLACMYLLVCPLTVMYTNLSC